MKQSVCYYAGVLLVLSLAVLAASQTAAQPSTELQDVVKMFDYDQKVPVDINEVSVTNRRSVTIHDITFDSPMGGRVSAYLVKPSGKGPFAGIIFLHSGQWDRHEFLAEAELLAQSGVVSLLLDAPPMRAKDLQHKQDTPLKGYIQMVVDCRRGIDVLEHLKAGGTTVTPLVDPKRIAYVGHSLGATWGPALALADRRIKAIVLMAGFSEFTTSTRPQIPPAQLEKAEPFLKAAAPLDADRLLPHLPPTAVLLQFAEFDQYIPHEDAQRSIQAVRDPKIVKWYEGAHEFGDPRALPDRAEFLHQQIGIAPLRVAF